MTKLRFDKISQKDNPSLKLIKFDTLDRTDSIISAFLHRGDSDFCL